jgi:DNA-binding IscR family transcriptional regulator
MAYVETAWPLLARAMEDADEIITADIIRAVEGPLAAVRGARPEDAAYPGLP